MEDLWRRPRQPALLAARPDQQGQFLEAAGRLAAQHGCVRAAAGHLYSATPLMVGGVLYTTVGTRRAVVALNAATGELLWMHAEDEGRARPERPAQRRGPGRGLLVERRRIGSTHHLRDARLPDDRPERQDRRAGCDLRPRRRRGSEARQRSGARSRHRRARPERHAARRGRRRGRRRRASGRPRPEDDAQREGLRARLRRARPASGCGSSTRFRSPASSATTPGRTTRR